jgi:hypothetical protein
MKPHTDAASPHRAKSPSKASKPREEGALSKAEVEELRRTAAAYPFMLYGSRQLAAMIPVHVSVMAAIVAHAKSPFLQFPKKARPEWVFAFLQNPPADFSMAK